MESASSICIKTITIADFPHKTLDAISKMYLLKQSIERQVTDFQCLVGMDELSSSIGDVDERGLTNLHYAAWYNLPAKVDLLIAQGADVAARDPDGATALHYAARYKQRFFTERETKPNTHSVIESLLLAGGDINDRDKFGSTPLFFAVLRGNEDAAGQLIRHKDCDVNAADRRGQTCLHLAAKYDRERLAKKLLEAGARLVVSDDCGLTPLHMACMEGNTTVAELFLNFAGKDQIRLVNALNNEGTSPLDLAVENGEPDVVRLCLQNGAIANKTCRDERASPLHLACKSGCPEVVKMLLKEDSSLVRMPDGSKQSPLHWAARYDKANIVEILLQWRADLEVVDSAKMTPLLCACAAGSLNCLELLIEQGADVTALSSSDQSAVHLAAINNRKMTMAVLLEHLKDSRLLEKLISSDDRIGNSPLHYAAQHGYVEVAKNLLELGADPENKNEDEAIALHVAAECGRTGVVREILAQCLMPTIVLNEDEDSNTPLHLAAANGHAHACEVLIEKGANIKDRNRMLWTPLCAAAHGGWRDTLRVLLRAGSDIRVFDRNMNTPAHLAAKEGHDGVLRMLLDKGASMSTCNEDGFNPLDVAIAFGNKDVATVIILSDQWKEALRNRTEGGINDATVTPFRKLVINMPDVAEMVMDRCIQTSPEGADLRDAKLEIKFDFEFVEDTYVSTHWGGPTLLEHNVFPEPVYNSEGELLDRAEPYTYNPILRVDNHALKYIALSKLTDLVYHPLVLAVVRHKWKLAQIYFFFFLFFYVIFVAIVTTYMALSTPPYMLNHTLADEHTGYCKNMTDYHVVEAMQTLTPREAWFAGILVWIFAGLGMLFEVTQAANVCWHYLEDPVNLLDWFVYIAWIIVVMPLHPCFLRTSWQWQLGAVAMFAAWINLILFLRRMPLIGIYYVMVGQVFITFIKFFLFCFSLFLIAFSFTFFVLLRNQAEFHEPQSAFVKVFVMMIGELEYSGVFHSDSNSTQVAHRHVTLIIFLMFLCMVTIVIMNLLTGLAVGDVEAVQEDAKIKKLAMQIDLILEVEIALPERLRRRLKTTTPHLILHPNKIPFKLFHKLAKYVVGPLSAKFIASSVFKELKEEHDKPLRRRQYPTDRSDDTGKLQDAITGRAAHYQTGSGGNQAQIKEKLKQLETKLDKLTIMMQTVLQRQDAAWHAEDQHEES